MIRKLLMKLGKTLIGLGINWVFNYVDKNNDGKLSREEIDNFIADIRKKLSQIKNKNY
jgi:Ca2+-binding EF-hand superfamily protein